jgi:deazaflavin-dependent oxidoreductase (nitroreductase family)
MVRLVGLGAVADGLDRAAWPRMRARVGSGHLRRTGAGRAFPRLLALGAVALGAYLLVRRPRAAGDHHAPADEPAGPSADARAMIGARRVGPLRVLFRAPVYLYRLSLGGLLGHRFLLLTHRGRTSGKVYRTVIEVVHYDPRTHENVVVSGWGTRADWYRNVRASPPIAVESGGERFAPVVRELAPEENFPIVANYVRRLPRLARPLVSRLGFDIKGTEEERRAHAARLLLVAFRPRLGSA